MQHADDKLYTQAVSRFQALYAEAQKLDLREPSAMSLATVDDQGRPSVRTVLLKSFDARGFVFYTNKLSRKGRQLASNPNAALCFLWQPLMQQVLVEGEVENVTVDDADAYWATRARVSQIGAWASQQSSQMGSRAELETRFAECEKKFADKPVPRPPYWSGYRLRPRAIEFWSSRPGRLHERESYRQGEAGAWAHHWLYP
jgi:pyridoxamine 5'-phosphate oxidase